MCLRKLIRLLTPRSFLQWCVIITVWTTLFNIVFYGVLTVFGQRETFPSWMFMMIGALTCAPFVTAAMLMLQMHLRLQRKLHHAARTDLLTNMPNRRAFIDTVGKRLPYKDGALLMIDVDRFKAINDTYGHSFGDDCLRRMADNIRPVIPASFYYARLGGEEFGVMMFGNSPQKMRDVGKIISAGIRIRPPGSKTDIRVTCSVGACIAQAGDDLSVLLSEADRALYYAKETGRAKLVVADQIPVADAKGVTLLAG